MSKSLKDESEDGLELLLFATNQSELSDDDYDPNDMDFGCPSKSLKQIKSTDGEGDQAVENSGQRKDLDEHETLGHSLAQKAFEIKDEIEPMDIFANNASTSRARKRQRMVLDCVLIKKRQKVDDIMLDSYKNPKVKMDRSLALHPETVRYRLKAIGLDIQEQYFTIDKATREVMVTRLFMSSIYGGDPVSTFPKIGKVKFEEHGMNDFMYVSTDFQPHAPEIPGAPALWLSSGVAHGCDWKRRTFTKIQDPTAKNNNKWLYVGQYDLVPANPPFLTVEEWNSQEKRFHNKWATAILNKGWGACAPILALKELGREPTLAEIEDVDARKLNYADVLTVEDIKVAYASGRQRMGVYTMKCVGYDNNFQSQLSQRFPTWTHNPVKKSKSKVKAEPKLKTENTTKIKKQEV